MSLLTIDPAQLHLRANERVLDLGCGEGRHAIDAWLRSGADVTGVDLSAGDLETARTRQAEFAQADARGACRFIQASGLRLPFPDNSFDRVICAEVLEHIDDYGGMLDEIRRVLKPAGLFATSVPRFWPEWLCWRLSREYHEVPGGHVRIFHAAQLRQSIEARGFYCYRSHGAHSLHVPYWWLRCLFWRQGENFAPVRAWHRLLVWDLMHAPRITRALDRLLNPVMGKSVVMYFCRPAATPPARAELHVTAQD